MMIIGVYTLEIQKQIFKFIKGLRLYFNYRKFQLKINDDCKHQA